MTELEEVAAAMRPAFRRAFPNGATLEECRAFVRVRMEDDTPTVHDGVAWALYHDEE